jgi:DNA-binding GntR family transcriptional regulator
MAEQIHQAIQDGRLEPGSLLGNEIGLADRFGLSRPTMRSAIQELVDKGVLVRKRGVGTQVVQGPINRTVQLTSLFDDLARADQHPRTAVLTNEVIPASDDVSAALKLPRRHPVLHLRRVRYTDNKPLAILDNYLPHQLVDIGGGDLAKLGLYQLMRTAGVRMKVAKQRIGAREGTPDECRWLNEPMQSPLLTMERITNDDTGKVVEWGRHVYRPSHYQFSVTLVGR